ncbi:alpha/beta fold hydrolase [Nocardia asteroides]|uniref:alpha/beta fold hydrolase n=1 Tax=Nocardia asteroides TaxID=1824 RepID=UPI001E5A7B9B|nr:alpha/beta hydrolase [Nocardia asteroides]UGT63397.1 alpha/beta hydrolase [Nocardia asteroides]
MEAVLGPEAPPLYYRTRGSGPVVLLLPGGDGDADSYDDLAGQLSTEFTVVSYDRRGLSRSAGAGPPAGIAAHADDAAAVLSAVTDAPAFVFGSSIGAVIALELLGRRRELVRRAVVHEPPVAALLTEPERTELATAQSGIEAAHRRDGMPAAMALFARLAGLGATDRESGVELPAPGPYRADNLEYFLTYDAPAVRAYLPDLPALRAGSAAIVPALGAATSGVVARCAPALAELLGVETALFPGGHTGPRMHPRAYAEQLRSLFDPEQRP